MGINYQRGFNQEPSQNNNVGQKFATGGTLNKQFNATATNIDATRAAQHINTDSVDKPNSWLALAILSTIFCCLPFGIVAIVYAVKVDTLWYSGYTEDAIRAANSAKIWTLVSIFSVVAVAILYAIVGLIALYLDGNL